MRLGKQEITTTRPLVYLYQRVLWHRFGQLPFSLPAHHRTNRRSRSFRNRLSATFNGSKVVIVEEVEDKEPSTKKRKKAAALAEPVEINNPPPPSRSNPFIRPSEVIELVLHLSYTPLV